MPAEGPRLPTLLDEASVVELGGQQYRVDRGIARSGESEVYAIHLASEGSGEGTERFALKVYFPFYSPIGRLGPKVIARSLAHQVQEHGFLKNMSHPNIVRVFGHGKLPATDQLRERLGILHDVEYLPYIIEEFIIGHPLDDAIKRNMGMVIEEALGVLRKIAGAIRYIHSNVYLHTDIKPSNILVRERDFEPFLIDFGLAKNLNRDEVVMSEETPIYGDYRSLLDTLPRDHPVILLLRDKAHIPRDRLFSLLFPTLDLFKFGTCLRDLLPILNEKIVSGGTDEAEAATVYHLRQYLQLMVDQLTNWRTVCDWKADDLEQRLTRATSASWSTLRVPELAPMAEREIVIPPGLSVPVTRKVLQIIENRSFRRLSNIHQLSLLSLVYPASDYKRSVHVQHTYFLARQLIASLYTSPIFRFHMSDNEIRKLLILSLLHDINHFPFLHTFQESDLESVHRAKIFDFFCDGRKTQEGSRPSIYDLVADFGMTPEDFRNYVLSDTASSTPTHADQIIKSSLNSGVDLDKLSYIYLDAYFTGVKYGLGIDYPALFHAATILPSHNLDGPLHLTFRDSAIQALEHVVMCRYWNFKSIYWHHTNRAIMAMLLDVVQKLYQDRNIDDYLEGTLWENEIGAARYLDRIHRERFGRPSILDGLFEDRSVLYRRLYTVRAGLRRVEEEELYSAFYQLRSLPREIETSAREKLAFNLSGYLSTSGKQSPLITADDILIDIPGRKIEGDGGIFVDNGSEFGVPLKDLSTPIAHLIDNYEQLTKRIRFFISPAVYRAFGASRRLAERDAIRANVLNPVRDYILSIPKLGRGEVR